MLWHVMLRNCWAGHPRVHLTCRILTPTSCVACNGAATTCPASCKWWLEQPPRAFRLEVTAHRWCESSYSICIPSLKFIGLPVLKIWLIWPLTFRPMDGSWITRVMGFLPTSFQLSMPFRSQLRVRHGQTDNGHQCIMPPPDGIITTTLFHHTVSTVNTVLDWSNWVMKVSYSGVVLLCHCLSVRWFYVVA